MADPTTTIEKVEKIEKAPARLGVMPSSVEEGWRLAQMMAKSDLVPSNFRGKPEDVIVAIQMGAEIGFAPMQALQSIAVINGRPTVWGDGLLALIMASPLYADHTEYFEVNGESRISLTAEDLKLDTTAALCTFLRKGKPTPTQRVFSIGHARRAGLWTKKGPWQEYPDRMLLMRARQLAARDAFPDLLRGIRTAEEVLDMDPETDAPHAPYIVRRKSEVAPDVPPPPSPLTVIGPVQIISVDIPSARVTLSTGQTVAAEDPDLAEFQKFIGTDHQLRLTVRHDAEQVSWVQDFTLVD